MACPNSNFKVGWADVGQTQNVNVVIDHKGNLGGSLELGPEFRSCPNTTKGIDLLEVYCDENSQLTQQILQKGGKAARFTRTD